MALPEIGTRPARPRYKDVTFEIPDMVLQDSTDQNIMYLFYRYFNATGNCYKICRVTRQTITLEGITGVQTLFEYPFGCASYDFDYELAAQYPYSLPY